jgi:hypothetical protein
MMKKTNLFIASIALLTMFSCETDIEINAPYKDITVVYGLIDPAVDTQYVRITKAFLGEGDINNLAQDANNFNYPDGELEVLVQEINANGNVVNTYSTEVTGSNEIIRTVNEVIKEEGAFDNSENVLFRFIAPSISLTSTYKLIIRNAGLDKEVVSETLIVENSIVAKPSQQQQLSFWSGSPSTGNNLTQLFNVTTGKNVGRVDGTLVFYYNEHYTNGDSPVIKFVKIPMGEVIADSPLGNESLEWEMEGETFFDKIITAVPASVPNLDYREVDYIDLEFNVAGTELSTYMTVSAPSTSINQNKSTYTNITNGLGIFSSRSIIDWNSTAGSPSYQLNIGVSTMKKLNTLGRGFCFGPTTPTSQFGCNY